MAAVMKEVINDAGHGGTDPGAYANGQREKDWTLEAAIYVNTRLIELGVSSKMTRTEDETLDWKPRTDIVKQSGADICLSHHFNAGGGKGAETIHSIFSSDKLAKLIADEIAAAGMPIRRVFKRKGRNGKDYYYMHRETGRVETVIIEYGFLDTTDYNKLKDKSFRFKLYEAVVKATCIYIGATYKERQEPKQEPKDGLWRVQVGAFSQKENAEALAKKLKSEGYPTYIVKQ